MKVSIKCRDCVGSGFVPDVCPDRRAGCLVYHTRQCPYCRGKGTEIIEAERVAGDTSPAHPISPAKSLGTVEENCQTSNDEEINRGR